MKLLILYLKVAGSKNPDQSVSIVSLYKLYFSYFLFALLGKNRPSLTLFSSLH